MLIPFLAQTFKKADKRAEETKGSFASDYDLEIKNNELYSEISNLKDKVSEYKANHIESLKYKEKLDELAPKGVINREGKEIIKF